MNTLRLRIILIGLGLLFTGVIYFLFNPMQYAFFPACPFYSLTGWYCPGCGSQRAFHALLHGHFLQAVKFNVLAVVLLPFIVYSAVILTANAFFNKHWQQKLFYKPWFVKMLLGVVLLFWLLRNLPLTCFHWMAP